MENLPAGSRSSPQAAAPAARPRASPASAARPDPTPRPAHALELVLDDADDEAVRCRWTRLEEAGVPSAARHTGTTHRPHLTVASGPSPSEEVLEVAARLLVPLLPVGLPVAGLVLLGRPGRTALAELVAPTEDLRDAREKVRRRWQGSDDRPWVAHLTLAPRLVPEEVALALAALAEDEAAGPPRSRLAVGLRWWDPDTGTARILIGGHV